MQKLPQKVLDFYTYSAYLSQINQKIVQLTKEGLGIRSISRVLKISTTTILKRLIVIAKSIKIPIISFNKTYEVDEMRFFSKSKNRLFWLVYALERESKNVMSFQIGKKNINTLQSVIKTLLFSNAKKIYTDKLRHYQYLIPKFIHSNQSYQTNHIERNNLTIRTHLKRFQRKGLGFSKNLGITSAILRIYFWG